MDISPWVNNQEDWLQPFVYACKLDFVHTSGGRTTAESGRIRARMSRRAKEAGSADEASYRVSHDALCAAVPGENVPPPWLPQWRSV